MRILLPYFLDQIKGSIETLNRGLLEIGKEDSKEVDYFKSPFNPRLPKKYKQLFLSPLSIQCISKKYDIIHTGPSRLHILFKLLLKLRNRELKHIHTAYGTVETHKLEEIKDSKLRRQFLTLFKSADQVVAVSYFVRKVLRTHLGINSKVIYNGVDTDFFKPERKSDKVLQKYKLNKPLVLYVGRLIGKKRPDLVLEMAERFREVTFAIRGNGRLPRKKFQTNVKFLPFLREVELAELFATSDVFLFPSEHEPFGLVTVEAMSSGTPVIGHNSGATKEIVEDGKTGFLTDNTTSDLSEKLSRILEDEGLRKKMGKRARERVENKFSLHRMTREYSNLYDSVITG